MGDRAEQLGANGQQERNNSHQHLGVVLCHNRSLFVPLETIGAGRINFRINGQKHIGDKEQITDKPGKKVAVDMLIQPADIVQGEDNQIPKEGG